MNGSMTKLLSLALVLALSGTAAAETEEREGRGTDDEDVSQINGQLVPVGKHNEYRYSLPRWNVATNPLGWVLGIYGVSLSYGVSDQLALRGDINYMSGDADEDSGYEFNAGLPIYFRRTYQGLFLEPGVMVRRYEGFDESREYGPQVLAGWHWRWDSGFNAAFALGMGKNLSGESPDGFDEDEFFNGYLRFGYAF